MGFVPLLYGEIKAIIYTTMINFCYPAHVAVRAAGVKYVAVFSVIMIIITIIIDQINLVFWWSKATLQGRIHRGLNKARLSPLFSGLRT